MNPEKEYDKALKRVLRILRNASPIEVVSAYEILTRKYAPHAKKDQQAREQLRLINQAYGIFYGNIIHSGGLPGLIGTPSVQKRFEIDLRTDVMVRVDSPTGDLNLYVESSNYVTFRGKGQVSHPSDFVITASDYTGDLIVPKKGNIILGINKTKGDITGKVIHKGYIKHYASDLDLIVEGNLGIDLDTETTDDVRINGLIQGTNGILRPEYQSPNLPVLSIEKTLGKVKINYIGH